MKLAWWICVYFLGMGSQAAISAALFPGGIDPAQQLRAALLFAVAALLFAGLALTLDRRTDRR
jgi:hypothetical protein